MAAIAGVGCQSDKRPEGTELTMLFLNISRSDQNLKFIDLTHGGDGRKEKRRMSRSDAKARAPDRVSHNHQCFTFTRTLKVL